MHASPKTIPRVALSKRPPPHPIIREDPPVQVLIEYPERELRSPLRSKAKRKKRRRSQYRRRP